MSRHFTRLSGDYVECAAGGAASNRATGTWAVVWRADSVQPNGLIVARDNSGNGLWSCNPYADGNIYFSAGGSLVLATYAAATWYCLVYRRPSGAAQAVKVDVYDYGAGTWQHLTPGNLNDEPFGPNVTFRMGLNGGSDSLGGNLVAEAIWSTQLADADVLTLPAGMANWLALSPSWAVQFNQASIATAVTDLTGGGGNQVGISGTTVATGDDPPGWTYSGGSSVTPGKSAFLPFF